ncbi:vanin-like protein 1 isoform X2 [Athalia rosae]|nr:vanin-like protein 1 isoform X2 [Athalia rosae]
MAATKLSIIIFGLAIWTRFTFLQISAADATSYIGAVAEYYPTRTGRDGQINTLANAENIVTIVKKASEYHADIIVFPENGLAPGLPNYQTNRTHFLSYSSTIPDANTDTPCTNDSTLVSPAIRLMSCTARSQSMYLMVNVVEMEDCTATGTKFRPCPNDGYFFYNTNVAFNRNGTIVSRYRKFNLFGEAGLNVTSTPDISTFTTDFGVTFGHFICFDILFKTPTLSLINHYNITDILYPTHWFSELPYLTAVQAQSAWSYSNDVNLLASSYNNPATGSGGSGIFAGTSGQLVSLWSENATNTLLVAKVPK